MAEHDTRLAALLFDMQKNIREDIRDSEGRLSDQITDLKDDHGRRLEALEQTTKAAKLTTAQRRALWTVITGLAAEAAARLMKIVHVGSVRP